MIESDVTRAMAACKDPAILAASPNEQWMYHLLSFTKDSSTVSEKRFLRLAYRLRREHISEEFALRLAKGLVEEWEFEEWLHS